MKFFIFFAVFILIFYLIYRLALPRLTERYISETLASSESDEALPAQLLYGVMKKSRIFTDLSLPIPSKDGEEISIGTLAVNRSGVYIISGIRGEGVIENPNGQRWKHIFGGSCSEFDNPFRVQEGARNLIEYYAKNAGLSAVKAHSLLVYVSPELRFTMPLSRSVVSAECLCERLQSLDRRGRLTNAEVRRMCRVLSDIGYGS